MLPFLKAFGIIGGMIIGSGMFALPYAVRISGLWWGMGSAFVAYGAILVIHLAYGEVVLNSHGKHRLPGYVNAYFGRFWGLFEGGAQIIAFNAILLVYAILGGKFFALLFGHGTHEAWTLFFLGLSAAILLIRSAQAVGFINLLLTAPLIVATLWISLRAFAAGSLERVWEVSQGTSPFFAFGVFMFSLAGMSVIADAKSVFEKESIIRKATLLRRAIVLGTTAPLILYIIFIFGVLSISGVDVTEDALTGLIDRLGTNVVRIGALIGFLAVFTSYLSLGYDLREVYKLDRGVSYVVAWALTVIVPGGLFFLEPTSFIQIMALVGGFFVALDGLFIVLLLRAMRKKGEIAHQFLPFPPIVAWALMALFLASATYEVLYQISR